MSGVRSMCSSSVLLEMIVILTRGRGQLHRYRHRMAFAGGAYNREMTKNAAAVLAEAL